ncbi:efflux RND transporter periplasmic adaptor subunit [Acetobacter sp.]|jgi:RND family efflux transporter MFP subunit|uniref:efflux RND transporter periplasmic adaptor subunit n=1 Tax=Acetobacter sp. TaxID=440 RepID=UPI0025C060D9|nr:efflux RND transporter periplasmic adaptor subunit [Acetobacter sp.]MCH4091620.1 efflux RND transporter periplasmic adaptor subunit [Acetobacter sp.]MCI1301184.1 efflux RND transporter periplasmic adaptor subunit [Acetobacter sp.]MCI1317412.1 efflux RND transporter periplasmic adaptor subunit [Acetobacter sp.]
MARSIRKYSGLLLVAGVLVLASGYVIVERMDADYEVKLVTEHSAIPDVEVVTPEPGAKTVALTLPGTVDAWYQAPIYPQASGYVKMWYKDFGSDVKAGDVLADINAPSLDAQFAQAKADLDAQAAKYNLTVVSANRWHAMAQSQAVSGQSVSVADANKKSGYAEMQASQHNLDRFAALEKFKTVVAPFDGVVTSRDINVGDYVSAGGGEHSASGDANQMFVVSDMHRMRLFVSVPEVFSYMLKPGLTATVSVPQFPNRTFEAHFLTIAKGYDPNTRTAVTEFTIDNPDHLLWPGTFASVHLTSPAEGGIWQIPTSTLVFQEAGMQVAVVSSDNHAHFRSITVGRMADTRTDVISGLQPGDRIIRNPPADLLDNQEVRVVVPAKGYERADEEIEG